MCGNLSSVLLPETITTIGKCAFLECNSLTNIVLPESVTSVETGAFSGCNFTTFTFPQNIEFIGWNMFSYPSGNGLESIILLSPTPPTIEYHEYGGGEPESSFDAGTNNCPIYVPSGSVGAYKEAWPKYADRIMEMGTGGEMPGGGGVG